MALVVNSNIASLNAQRNLTASNNAMGVSLQRLSSGLRVNSAKDDAAALAISQGMTSQIRGSNQSIRNANDGISLGQTLEGALGQIGNMAQRIRELAVQSANASVSDPNRAQLQKEVDQLTQEISRVVDTTEFNGQFLLNSSASLGFQVGYDGTANNQVTVALTNLTAASGSSVLLTAGDTFAENASGAAALGTALGTTAANTALTLTAAQLNGGVASSAVGYSEADAQGTPVTRYLSFNSDVTAKVTTAGGAASGTGAIADLVSGTVLVKDASGNTLNTITLSATNKMTVTMSATAGTITSISNAVEISASTAKTLNAYNSNLSAVNSIDIRSSSDAVLAIEKMDTDLATLNTQRAVFGAVQNRFEAVVSNLSNYAENLSQSRSRMIDADFAEETANMTKNQVLQQAGVAILAQANSLPQAAMSLLR